MSEFDLDEFIHDLTLSGPRILELVDEYDLYCHYLEFQPDLRTAYKSPIREDDNNGSFSIFHCTRYELYEYTWKDSGYMGGTSGNVFTLIRMLYGLNSYKEVYEMVDKDFSLGFTSGNPVQRTKVLRYDRPMIRPTVKISIQSRLFDKADWRFWRQYGITEATLARFCVKAVEYYWMYADQECPTRPPGICFAYVINQFYKLYQPYNKPMKFRNDFPESYVEGLLQLEYTSDRLVITKSMKEIMWYWEHFRTDAIAGKSESTMVPDHIMDYLFTRYREIVIFLDNDSTGWAMMYKYKKKYGDRVRIVAIPKCLGLLDSFGRPIKDPTDLHAMKGAATAINVAKYCLDIDSHLRVA